MEHITLATITFVWIRPFVFDEGVALDAKSTGAMTLLEAVGEGRAGPFDPGIAVVAPAGVEADGVTISALPTHSTNPRYSKIALAADWLRLVPLRLLLILTVTGGVKVTTDAVLIWQSPIVP